MTKTTAPWPNQLPTSIIVRMPNWLGDLVMATPVLADLRQHFPRSKITAMCQSSIASLLREDPNIDELFSFNRPSGWLHRKAFRNILMPLRHGEHDLGVLLTNSFSSAWKFWRGNTQNRLGYSRLGRDFLLDKAVAYPEKMKAQHLVDTYKMLLEPLGVPLSISEPKLYLSSQEKKEVRTLLDTLKIPQNALLVGINPGAAYGAAKCWIPKRFQEVALKLLDNPNVHILFFGDAATVPLIDRICQSLPERAMNLAGKTSLRELVALIGECKAFLTNDSGPMHIASALGTPLVALFGSTSDVRTGPYKGGTVIHKRTSCSPCGQRICPIDFRCMKEIQVKEVVQAVQSLVY